MVLRDQCDALNQSRGIIGPLENQGGLSVQNNRGRLRQRFDLIRKLGQGTYGKVQLGIDKETGQEVAIKTIKKSKIETDADLIRIRREIQIMSSVKHPNIIHIYEVFENREKMVLVMEYAAGGELYDYLNERKILQDDEARRIFRQIASAVYYCHKHKICHRDLKLENILLDEKSNAKIADFGLSNVFDDLHLLKTFCGSPLYASPEIVRGTPYAGPEVDCWSLGVLLYTLVYGAMPFDGSNFKRLVKQISHGDYYEPKKPADASALIRLMLTVDPSKRATIKDVCNHNWVNKGADTSCLFIAEELANATPVRLDLLLSLAPSYDINHSQVVIESPSRANLAKPSTSTQPEATKTREEKEKKKVQERPSAAPAKPKRKVVPVVGSKSKKSKSSPVLELILDVDVEEDGGNEEGDTLSEISEIQTIAEEPKPKKKEPKPKSSHKEKSESLKEPGNSKEPGRSKESAKESPNVNEASVPVPKEPSNLKEPAVKDSGLKDPAISKEPAIPKEPKEQTTKETELSEKQEIKEKPKEIKKEANKVEIKKEEISPKAEQKEGKEPKAKQEMKTEEVRDIEKKTEKEPKKKIEDYEKPKLKEKLETEEKSEKELKDVPSTPKMIRKKSVKKVIKKKVEENSENGDKSSSPSAATNSEKMETSESKEKTQENSNQSKEDKKDENESNQEERGKNMIKRSDSNAGDKSENVSPTRIERRNSKIISQKTAELIQNLETKTTSSGNLDGAQTPTKPVPKKLVFPLFKVSEAKRAFEKPPKPVVPINTMSKISSNKFIAEKSENPNSVQTSQVASSQPAPITTSQSSSAPAQTTTPAQTSKSPSLVQKPPLKEKEINDLKELKPKEESKMKEESKPKEESKKEEAKKIEIKPENTDVEKISKPAPKEKATKAPIKKLIMPDKEMKSVLVDVGGVSPKSALLLVSGKTSGETLQLTQEPNERLVEEIPGGKKKEEAVKKICSVINKIVPSASSDGLPQKDPKQNVRTIRSEIVIPVSAPVTPGERIIPIRFAQDDPQPIQQLKTSESQPSMLQKKIEQNITRVPPLKILPQSPMLSRQNSSDTESSFASPPPRNEVIRKSPREFIIPIKMEGTGSQVTPKEIDPESSNAEDNFRIDSRLRPGRFERQKKYSSLLAKTSLDDEPSISTVSNSSRGSVTPTGPFHVRSHSQGDEPTEMVTSPGGTIKRLRVKRGGTLERSDSVSSAEDEEEDAFEVLTAESLFSSLLDRVRNLTRRLNRDGKPEPTWGIDDFWGKLPINDLMSRASSESRGMGDGSYVSRSYSREPSVSVTISRGPSRRSLSREMSGESDSVFSDPGQLGRSVNASLSSIGSGGCGRNLTTRNLLGARSSTPRDDSTFDTNSFRSLPSRRSLREFTPSTYDYSSPIRPHHHPHHDRSGSDIPPRRIPLHHQQQNHQSHQTQSYQNHPGNPSYQSQSQNQHLNERGDENSKNGHFRAASVEPTSRVGMLRSISMNPRFLNYNDSSIYPSRFSNFSTIRSESPFTRQPSMVGTDPSSSFYAPTGNLGISNSFTPSLYNNNNPQSSNSSYASIPNSSFASTQNSSYGSNPNSPYGSNQNSSFGSNTPYGTFSYSKPYSSYMNNSPYGPNISIPQQGTTENNPYGYSSTTTYGTNPTPPETDRLREFENKYCGGESRDLGKYSDSRDLASCTKYGEREGSCAKYGAREGSCARYGDSRDLASCTKYGDREGSCSKYSDDKNYYYGKPQVYYNNASNPMSNNEHLKSPSLKESTESEGFEKSKFNLPSLYNQPRMVRRYFSTLDEPKPSELVGLGKLPFAQAGNSNLNSSNNSSNGNNDLSNNGNVTQSSTLPNISRRDSTKEAAKRGIEKEMEKFSSPPPPDTMNRIKRVQSPETKRDLRATSVERITRFLERNSINSPPIEQPKVNKNDGIISPVKSKPFKPSTPVKDEKTQSSVLQENNEIPDSSPTLTTSKSVSKMSKFSKPKFLQSLEKKWEKLTSSEPKNTEEKTQDSIIIANPQNSQILPIPQNSPHIQNLQTVQNPQNSQIQKNLQTRSENLICENEDFLKSPNVISESMLLQRAVSPEKKCKEKLPGSTVNFMLGKFRKIEETATTTKIPNGKPPIGRRVQSVYAGTMSDSVLTLPYAPSKVIEKTEECGGQMSKFGEIKKASGIVRPSPLALNSPATIPESPTLGIKKFNQGVSINQNSNLAPQAPNVACSSINSHPISSTQLNQPINQSINPAINQSINPSMNQAIQPLINTPIKSVDLRTPSIETQVYQVLEPEGQTMSNPFNHKNKLRDSSLPPSLLGSSGSKIKSSDISNIPRFVPNTYKSDRLESEKRILLPEISISPELPRNNSEDLSEDLNGPVSPKSDSYDSSSVYSEKTDQSLKTNSVLDEEESVSDRIFRKSFYSRFNSLENKKKGGAASSPSFFQTSSSSSNMKKGSGNSGGSKVKHRSSTTTHFDGGTSERRPSRSPSNLDKYNPNPLFKELISDDFPSDVGRKAEYSRRVTSKLSKLLREIDAGNTAAANNANKLNTEKRDSSEKREKTPNPIQTQDDNSNNIN